MNEKQWPEPKSGATRVFVSFDIRTDCELYERLCTQSRLVGAPFAVSGGSAPPTPGECQSESARRRIREADVMIVICGESTEMSSVAFAELAIAREEETPYFLLWGRREVMCTKPLGARSSDWIFSWTSQILANQIEMAMRCSTRSRELDLS